MVGIRAKCLWRKPSLHAKLSGVSHNPMLNQLSVKKSQDCIRFVVLLFVIGPENLRHFLNQSNAKLEPTASQQLAFSALFFLHFEFSKALVTSSLICSDLLL